MPEITKDTTVREGTVYGHVRTMMVGSKMEFPICTVEEWKEMDADEAEQAAREAMWESGNVEWGY